MTVDMVSIVLLDKILNASDIDATAKQIQDLMIQAMLASRRPWKTRKYVVSAQDSHGVDITVDVPVIQNVASGRLGVSTEGDDHTKVVFDGANPITFGVQAIKLGFDMNGKITGFTQLEPGSGAARGLDD